MIYIVTAGTGNAYYDTTRNIAAFASKEEAEAFKKKLDDALAAAESAGEGQSGNGYIVKVGDQQVCPFMYGVTGITAVDFFYYSVPDCTIEEEAT